MSVSARHASVVWDVERIMSGKVASIVDIDKDWYWRIPLGLMGRWVMHCYFFQDGLTTAPTANSEHLALKPGFRFRLQRLRRCDGLLCRSFGCGVIWTFRDPALLCIDRFDWYEHLLQDYYRDLSLASDDKWRNMAKQKDAICVVSLEESVAQPRKCEHTTFGRGCSGCPCPQCLRSKKWWVSKWHLRILLRIVMPWGGWCLMTDSDRRCMRHIQMTTVSRNPWIKFILQNQKCLPFKNSFLSISGRRNFRRKTRICSFWSLPLGPKWLCRFLFPTTACWLQIAVRIVEVMWVGLGAGSPGLVDGTLWMRRWDAKWLNCRKVFQVSWAVAGIGNCFFLPSWTSNKKL